MNVPQTTSAINDGATFGPALVGYLPGHRCEIGRSQHLLPVYLQVSGAHVSDVKAGLPADTRVEFCECNWPPQEGK